MNPSIEQIGTSEEYFDCTGRVGYLASVIFPIFEHITTSPIAQRRSVLARNGSSRGKRSAYSRPGGAAVAQRGAACVRHRRVLRRRSGRSRESRPTCSRRRAPQLARATDLRVSLRPIARVLARRPIAHVRRERRRLSVGRQTHLGGAMRLYSSPAISWTRSTMRRRRLDSLMRMKALVSASPSRVARKSDT